MPSRNLHYLPPPYRQSGSSDERMNRKILKWSLDLAMGITFVICFVTGLLKFTLLLRLTGLNGLVLPSAFISDLHDWSGILLGLLVFVHLSLNRNWIISMAKQVIKGAPADN
jgi:hypothetical protein